ncbi:N-acetylmuramoyl-L-alanine amidase [Clostridium sp. SHJSY1]|uniref:N-acetylmuramoyl-L-alanine amidase n=1 Tax=Clostridium sp. SHJSY1 TaxID=2942483 RepID=UPI0028749EA4|nr:N-acetylmuramoyl-L-alanine amidase [Clostridium sp. SHJSY1]MDS0528086.1 N-acetylmuramoyl-L-alanine amidase [Clostridium sp. SHJSY1]
MSKINTLAIDMGHNVSYDIGAVGIRREDDLNREVVETLINLLRDVGINVINCTPSNASSLNDSLSQRCEKANNGWADFFISIHHNACPGGHGAEVWCITGGLAEEVANTILGEICSLGLSNRGVKDTRDLFVINQTSMPAILIECAFCDSEGDMSGYDTGAIGRAIFRGICRVFDIDCSGGEGSNSGGQDSWEEYYTVASGDTLWGISRKFGVSVDWLGEVNGIENRDLIYVGQRVRIR